MPFEAYKIYQEYELDKYKTSTQEKVAKALAEAKKEGLATRESGEEFLERFEEKSLEYIEKLLSEGANKDWVAMGLAGDYITFVWRKKYE